MTDWNAFLQDCVNETYPTKRPSRPARYDAGIVAAPSEYEPAESWGEPLPKLPLAQKPGRIMLALAALVSFVPLPIMPGLLIIPFVAGLIVFAGLAIMSGWALYIAP